MPLPLLFVCCYISAKGLPQGKVQISAHVFDQLQHVPVVNRVKFADSVYKKNFRKTDPATAMAALDKLRRLSIDLNDKPLECAVFDMRDDYYAYNRGFNPVSTAYYQSAIGFAKENKMPLQTGIYLNNMGAYLVIANNMSLPAAIICNRRKYSRAWVMKMCPG